jgi:hypothetical protein
VTAAAGCLTHESLIAKRNEKEEFKRRFTAVVSHCQQAVPDIHLCAAVPLLCTWPSQSTADPRWLLSSASPADALLHAPCTSAHGSSRCGLTRGDTPPRAGGQVSYEPNTLDIYSDPEEMAYWLGVLADQIPTVVQKAMACEGTTAGAGCSPPHPLQQPLRSSPSRVLRGAELVPQATCQGPLACSRCHFAVPPCHWVRHHPGTDTARICPSCMLLCGPSRLFQPSAPLSRRRGVICVCMPGCADARRRASAFGHAFAAHLEKLRTEPQAYGEQGLAGLFEMREECLREFGFTDVYKCVRSQGIGRMDVLAGHAGSWTAWL